MQYSRCNQVYPQIQQLQQQLFNPETIQMAVQSIAKSHATRDLAQMKGSTEVKGLAVALTTSEDPQSTLNFIKRHGIYLYQALALQHLGRVMLAGMISWDTLMHWTVSQPPQQETGRATVPSESAQQEHQGRRQTPATRFFIPHNKSDKRQEVQREDL